MKVIVRCSLTKVLQKSSKCISNYVYCELKEAIWQRSLNSFSSIRKNQAKSQRSRKKRVVSKNRYCVYSFFRVPDQVAHRRTGQRLTKEVQNYSNGKHVNHIGLNCRSTTISQTFEMKFCFCTMTAILHSCPEMHATAKMANLARIF